jgi:hypothetical protein
MSDQIVTNSNDVRLDFFDENNKPYPLVDGMTFTLYGTKTGGQSA